MDPLAGGASQAAPTSANVEAANNVLYSEVGINVLLVILKQSIASVRDFSGFLVKRAKLAEEHAKGLEKLSRATNEAIRRPDGRQGSYAAQMLNVFRAHDRMAEHGVQFANSLSQMHQDLDKLASTMDQNRKHWKQEGTANERKVKDAESALEKAKAKYDSLADDYDKARTGGGGSGRVFTVKGPKSAEKHEEDLHRKVQAADADYASRVQSAQSARQENLSTSRPQAIKALQELIRECDSALALQLQKFAALNEKLLVGNGLEVSPMSAGDSDASRALSMREVLRQIDSERDYHNYIMSHSGSVPPKPAEIRYQKHPTLGGGTQSTQSPSVSMNQRQSFQQASPAAAQTTASAIARPPSSSVLADSRSPQITSLANEQPSAAPAFVDPAPIYNSQRAPSLPASSFSTSDPNPGPSPNAAYGYDRPLAHEPNFAAVAPQQQTQPSYSRNGAEPPAMAAPDYGSAGRFGAPLPTQQNTMPTASRSNGALASQRLAPMNPVFGQSLEALFRRDDTAIPLVVYQCVQAIDLFGLDVEGIYRLSGNASHINQLKSIFDNDSSAVDFRNPEAFFHDINSVAGLLKQFFRELPDPLLTSENYNRFIEAAKIDDDNMRRDSVHAVVNELPDPNYATLRAFILHLHRVVDHAQNNRMSTHNLAICLAPALMGQHAGPHMVDAGLQARVIDTILRNTFQIFDED